MTIAMSETVSGSVTEAAPTSDADLRSVTGPSLDRKRATTAHVSLRTSRGAGGCSNNEGDTWRETQAPLPKAAEIGGRGEQSTGEAQGGEVKGLTPDGQGIAFLDGLPDSSII